MEQYGGPAAPPRPPKPAARVHAAGRAPVSLQRPRPEEERAHNAYVEAPRARDAVRDAVRAQPGKGARPAPTAAPPALASGAPQSVVCGACGRCRCEQCARPRALPSRWLCDWCLCSAEAAVDYASCMCCVKAALYHCAREEEARAEEPCACGGRAPAARWGCVAALALALPCLWLYWPLRACAAGAGRLYARTSRSGCRCARAPHRKP